MVAGVASSSSSLLYQPGLSVLGAASMSGSSTRAAGKSGLDANRIRSRGDQKWSDRVGLDGIGTFLRTLYPEKTAANVAADTGLPVDSIKKWLNGEASPGFKATVVLIGVYGPGFVSAMFQGAPEWVERAASEERLSQIEAEIAALEAQRASIAQR